MITLAGSRLIIPPCLPRLLVQLPRPAVQPALPAPPGGRVPLFPGRIPGLTIVGSRLSPRLKEHEILARGGRNTALINLAADLPAPILADLLGVHIATSQAWPLRHPGYFVADAGHAALTVQSTHHPQGPGRPPRHTKREHTMNDWSTIIDAGAALLNLTAAIIALTAGRTQRPDK